MQAKSCFALPRGSSQGDLKVVQNVCTRMSEKTKQNKTKPTTATNTDSIKTSTDVGLWVKAGVSGLLGTYFPGKSKDKWLLEPRWIPSTKGSHHNSMAPEFSKGTETTFLHVSSCLLLPLCDTGENIEFWKEAELDLDYSPAAPCYLCDILQSRSLFRVWASISASVTCVGAGVGAPPLSGAVLVTLPCTSLAQEQCLVDGTPRSFLYPAHSYLLHLLLDQPPSKSPPTPGCVTSSSAASPSVHKGCHCHRRRKGCSSSSTCEYPQGSSPPTSSSHPGLLVPYLSVIWALQCSV
jgi:hypothetical protein